MLSVGSRGSSGFGRLGPMVGCKGGLLCQEDLLVCL